MRDARFGAIWLPLLFLVLGVSACQGSEKPSATGTKRAASSGPRGGGEPGAAKRASPDSGLPDTTTASYGDWVLRCSLQSGEKLCEVAQTLRLQGRQDPFAVIAVGRELRKAGSRDASGGSPRGHHFVRTHRAPSGTTT
jgi:invasion protein IalB